MPRSLPGIPTAQAADAEEVGVRVVMSVMSFH